MKRIIIAGLIALTAGTAFAGGPHYGNDKCRNMLASMVTVGITGLGLPVAVGILPAFLVGCDHHEGGNYGINISKDDLIDAVDDDRF